MMDHSFKSATLLVAALVVLSGCDRFTSVETRMSRASSSLESGEYQSALIDLRKVLDGEPANVDALLLLSDVMAASGESQAARTQLDAAIKAGASLSVTEARQLELLLALGDDAALKLAIEASTTLSPAERNTFTGRTLLLERRPADALAAFDQALVADPAIAEASLGRIEALAALGRVAEARDAIDVQLERDPKSGRAWLLRGSLAARDNDFPAATEAFARAIEHRRGMNRGQRLQAHVQRIEVLLASGQPDLARTSLAGLEAEAGGSPIVSLMRAGIALASKDPATAVNELRSFTQAAPQHMTGRLLLVTALQYQGSAEQAYAEAVRNVSEFPDRDEPRLALADVLLRMGRPTDAEETLQPLTTRTPPNPLGTAMLAEIRLRSGELVAGISLLEQGLAESPRNSRLQLQLAAAYLANGEARRALQILDSVHDSDSSAARDHLHVIATAALQGSSSIHQELETAIARHPRDVNLLLTAAAYAANAGEVEQARAHLRKALEFQPDEPMLVLMLARLELTAGQIQTAESLAKAALERSPNDAAILTLMAAIAGQRGQVADADAWLNRARVANPRALDVSLALARRAAGRGNAAEAHAILADAVRNAPEDPAARVALAGLLASQNQNGEALKELADAARRHPTSALIPLAMAGIQLGMKNPDAARDSLRQSLKLSPGWLPAANVLANLEAAAGRLPAALDVVKAVRRADPNGSASYILEGDVYSVAQRQAQAAAAYSAAYRLIPGSAAAIHAMQAKRRANINAPEAELLDWVAKTPADFRARRALSDFYMSVGRNGPAIQELEKVVQAQPADGLALNNLAWLYQQAKDSRALPTAEKAYGISPGVAAVGDTYGWILFTTGDSTKALEVLRKAAALAPENGQIQLHFAHALSTSGKRDEAVTLLRRLVTEGNLSGSESLAEARQLLATLAK